MGHSTFQLSTSALGVQLEPFFSFTVHNFFHFLSHYHYLPKVFISWVTTTIYWKNSVQTEEGEHYIYVNEGIQINSLIE